MEVPQAVTFQIRMITMRSIFIKLDMIVVVAMSYKREEEQGLFDKKVGQSHNYKKSPR
jgi:hypothetical protein